MFTASRTIIRSLGIALFAAILLTVPTTAYDLNPEIVDALNQHDTALVLTRIDNGIKIDPAYAPHYLIKGQIFMARNQLDEALEMFETALDKRSKLYEALYYKGLVLLKLGQLDEAEKALDEGLKRAKEEKALFHNGMGLLLLAREKYVDADVEFRKAIQTGPDMAEFHANLGDANYYNKIYPLAINEYNQVIEMDTTFLDVYFRLARAYVAQGQYSDALGQLRTVLTRDSLYTHAWEEIGRLYTMAGLSARDRDTKEQRFKEAIGSYRRYLELSNDSAKGEVFFNLGRSYFNLGGYPQADSAFEYVLSIGDVPTNIYLYLGRGKIGEERYEEGIAYLKKHLAGLKEADPDWVPSPEEADLYRRIGDAYKVLHDYGNAAENYVIASDLAPTNGRYAVEAAISFHQLKDFVEALKYYRKRIDIGPDSWNVYLNAAYCTLNQEDYEASVDYLHKVIGLDSLNEKAHSLLADTYLNRLQDCENGVMWMQKWYDLDSTNCDALKSLGLAYLAGTCPANYLRAVDYFSRALTCYKAKGSDNCGNTDLITYIAQSYHLHAAALLENDKKEESKKHFKNAYDWYQKCLKCDPGNADCKKGVRDTEFEF